MKVDEAPVVVSATYDASAAQVWNAITVVDEMRSWYFDNIPDFKAQVGFSTSFNVSSGEREFSHTWEVTEVVPGGKITYDWTFGNYPGRGATTFELSSRDGQTTLTLTNTVAEDFPDGVPEFERESCLGGWQYFIGQRLKEYLRSSVNQSYLLSRGTMEPSGWDRSFRSPGCPNP